MTTKFKKFTAEGLLVYGAGDTKIQARYKEDFILPASHTVSSARSVIQKRLAYGRLSDTQDFFKGWRTCQITNEQDATAQEVKDIQIDAKDVSKLSLNQLCQLAVNQNLKTDPAKVGSVEEARWRVEEEMRNAKQATPIKKAAPKKSKAKPQGEEFSKE